MEVSWLGFRLDRGAGMSTIRRLGRLVVVGALAAGLVACGGGSGGGSSGGGNSLPIASFTATPQSGDAPLLVAFDASASSDPDGSIASYAWNFADGSSGTGRTVSHTYQSAGSYAAVLTVTDNDGGRRTSTRTISVQQATGELEVTVTEEFSTPVQGATVTATVGADETVGVTDATGKVLLSGIPIGDAAVTVVQDTFATANRNVTIVANERATLAVTLGRIKTAAGGVFTTEVVGVPSADGRSLTFDVTVIVVDQDSQGIEGLNGGAFSLPSCTPSIPDNDTFMSECVRFSGDAKRDVPYTVTTAMPEDWEQVPAQQETDYAAALMLDQSGSVNATDPTGARLVSAKAFVESVRPGNGDAVLLAAFAEDNDTQLALIPELPLTTFDPFTDNGSSYFDELETLRNQASGDTPLYRSLYPEPADPKNDPAFTLGLIERVAATAPAGKRNAIVIFTDGDDSECGGPNVCRDKRQRVVAQALASNVDLFTIGLSADVNFEALGELARGGNGVFLYAANAEQLIPLYGSLGAMLSRSLVSYRLRWTVTAQEDGIFVGGLGRSVLGKVRVNAASTTFEVPFIVGIE